MRLAVNVSATPPPAQEEKEVAGRRRLWTPRRTAVWRRRRPEVARVGRPRAWLSLSWRLMNTRPFCCYYRQYGQWDTDRNRDRDRATVAVWSVRHFVHFSNLWENIHLDYIWIYDSAIFQALKFLATNLYD
jgi:hypothetical protein